MKLRFHSQETFYLASHILSEYQKELGIGAFRLDFIELIMEFYSNYSIEQAKEEFERAQLHEDVDYREIIT